MQVNSTTAGSAVVVMTSENFERFVCGGRVADRRHLPGEPNPCLYAHCSSDKFEDFDRVFFFLIFIVARILRCGRSGKNVYNNFTIS